MKYIMADDDFELRLGRVAKEEALNGEDGCLSWRLTSAKNELSIGITFYAPPGQNLFWSPWNQCHSMVWGVRSQFLGTSID